ncbi:MAG: hypothetical protein ACRC1K_08110, partial [Planctomycetia bacterium]
MLESLLRTIGLDDEVVRHVDQATLVFQHPMLLLVGLLLLVPAALFIHRRQKVNLYSASPRLRAALTTSRVFVLAVMVLIAAGPMLKIDQQTEIKPIAAIVLDHTQSMTLPAGPFPDDETSLSLA